MIFQTSEQVQILRRWNLQFMDADRERQFVDFFRAKAEANFPLISKFLAGAFAMLSIVLFSIFFDNNGALSMSPVLAISIVSFFFVPLWKRLQSSSCCGVPPARYGLAALFLAGHFATFSFITFSEFTTNALLAKYFMASTASRGIYFAMVSGFVFNEIVSLAIFEIALFMGLIYQGSPEIFGLYSFLMIAVAFISCSVTYLNENVLRNQFLIIDALKIATEKSEREFEQHLNEALGKFSKKSVEVARKHIILDHSSPPSLCVRGDSADCEGLDRVIKMFNLQFEDPNQEREFLQIPTHGASVWWGLFVDTLLLLLTALILSHFNDVSFPKWLILLPNFLLISTHICNIFGLALPLPFLADARGTFTVRSAQIFMAVLIPTLDLLTPYGLEFPAGPASRMGHLLTSVLCTVHFPTSFPLFRVSLRESASFLPLAPLCAALCVAQFGADAVSAVGHIFLLSAFSTLSNYISEQTERATFSLLCKYRQFSAAADERRYKLKTNAGGVLTRTVLECS